MKNEAAAAAQERPRDKERRRKKVLNLRLSRIANASIRHGGNCEVHVLN